MEIQTGDYLVCRSVDNPNRKFVGCVTSVGKRLIVVDENERHIAPNEVEIEEEQIVAQLGQDPEPGTIYGCDVSNLYRRTVNHPIWGEVHFFYKPPKSVSQGLKKSLSKTGERLDKLGFGELFTQFSTEIRRPRGKYAGMYIHRGKKKLDSLIIAPDEEQAAAMNYVLYHEFGHSIWKCCLRYPTYAAWSKVFSTTVQCKPIEVADFKRILKAILSVEPDVLEGGLSVRELIGSSEDEDLLTYRIATRYMTQVHHVSEKDFRSLLIAGKEEQVRRIWPRADIDVDDLKPLISEYATKNVGELFAETFAFYMVKKKLPERLVTLLEKSLSLARHQAKYLQARGSEEVDSQGD